MASTGPNDHTGWVPGLGHQSNAGSRSFPAELGTSLDTQGTDPKVDEVQYSIVCDGCGKHFWSRSKADAHAALTAHVLHKEYISPSSPVAVLESPTAGPASSLETNALFASAMGARAGPDMDKSDRQDNEDSGDEEYSRSYDCSSHFWSREAAYNHAKLQHMQDKDLVHSSVSDGSPASATVGPAVIPTSLAADSSVHSNTVCWNTRPVYSPFAANGGTNATSPSWSQERTISPANAPTSPAISPTFPVYDGDINPNSMYGTLSQAMDPIPKQFSRPTVPSSEFEASHSESDDVRRGSSGASSSPSTSWLLLAQDPARPMNKGDQTVWTPTSSNSPPASSSCATLEHPPVTFPRELYDRVIFIVIPSGNRKGPGFIMGLPEAQNAETFRTGVRSRLESHGEQIGFRDIIAHIPWLSVPVYANSNEDHYHMLMVVKFWPEWQTTNWEAFCHILVTVEDEKGTKEKTGKSKE